MGDLLVKYEPVNPTTWAYLASLLLIALYFKFSRLWSMRNLDLLGMMALAPGLLLVNHGHQSHSPGIEQFGYVWLFSAGGLLSIRLLLDSLMVRRPLLEPNLSVGGLAFMGGTLFFFLMVNVLVIRRELIDLPVEELAQTAPVGTAENEKPPELSDFSKHGPGNPLFFHAFSNFWTHPPLQASRLGEARAEALPKTEEPKPDKNTATDPVHAEPTKLALDLHTRVIAVTAHFLIILGLVLVGYRHFDNIRTGIAAAVLYLLLPYTAQWTGQVIHAVPAAIIVWAVVFYRRPLLSGMLIGLGIGIAYYPIFLLPLWIGFYARRGWRRFLSGMFLSLLAVVGWLWYSAANQTEFVAFVKQTLGIFLPTMEHLEGFWGFQFIDPVYRVTVLAAFVTVACSLAIWPSRKNLGTLLCCSAVVMLGVQFWHAHRGGLYMAWYLPLTLLTVFRPNLEDRVAVNVVSNGWLFRRKPTPPASNM